MKKKTKVTRAKTRFSVPVVRINPEPKPIDKFPLSHYSYSAMVKFSTNPILFKINYINGQTIDTLRNVSGVIGQSFHTALESFYTALAQGSEDAVNIGLTTGMDYLKGYNDGFIDYSTSVENKQKALENFAAVFASYMNDKRISKDKLVSCEELIEEYIDLEWRGQHVVLPVKLKGYIDKIVRDPKGRLKIVDYKTTRAFSDPERIDGSKIIQAIQYYFLVYAKYGEAPYSMVYEEVKISKNRDGSSQIREYEIVYDKSESFFEFYFRFYDDMTRAINGEAVFVPNIQTMFDNEVSIMAYIHRLDVSEEAAAMMRALKVESITELLKKKIQHATSMRRFLKTAQKKFIGAKNINYKNMTIPEKIITKLMEHGMLIELEGMVSGHTVDLYKFSPHIGLKMSKLMGFTADIEQIVGVSGVRILAPIPDTSLIGFEVPRKNRTFPASIPMSNGFDLAMGVDINGDVFRFDIRQAPHMLVAGATGSGKSVFLNSVISQISQIPNAKLHLFDPKIVELVQFKGIAESYLVDSVEIAIALMGLVDEMNVRYKKLAAAGARSIEKYTVGDMPYIFAVIDEYADLILSGPESDDVARAVQLLAQKARACGIHLIIATQRPSVDIITGSIKTNFPTKVAFRTAKAIDSQVLLDESGAEKLLGKGDMLFSCEFGKFRLQGYSF